MRKIALLGLTAMILLFRGTLHSAESFTFYTYHDKPPYYFNPQERGQEKGVYESFAEYLNRLQKEVDVRIRFEPRKRLDYKLGKNTLEGAIIGVNPLWFGDGEKTKYLWSDPFMKDRDVVVTKHGRAFPYAHPRDFEGKRLALPRGLYFWGVTERFNQGKIRVEETKSDVHNLDMLLRQRVDATIMSILSVRYFVGHRFNETDFQILEVPHDNFERMALFPKKQSAVYEKLGELIKKSLSDTEWTEILRKNGYEF